MAADDYCYLTTTGRRTGRPHRIEIWYEHAEDGDTLYLMAGAGRKSDWVLNVVSDPAVRVEIGNEVHAGTARILDDGPEADRARALVYDKYAPRYGGDLTAWRARALPVGIDLAGSPDE